MNYHGRPSATRLLGMLALAVLGPACGGSGGGTATPPLTLSPGIRASGGLGRATNSYAGTGGIGGMVRLYSRGNITADALSPPLAPMVPAAPNSGTVVTSASLTGTSYTQALGNLLIPNTVTTTAPAATYTINCSTGDIVVSGYLLSGDGGTPANLVLNAPVGTVYVPGVIATSNQDAVPDGLPVGSVQINARRIVITGVISTWGEHGGGNGNSISLTASGGVDSDIFIVGGELRAGGGSNDAGSGGSGGAVTIDAERAVYVHSFLPNTVGISTAGGYANGSGTISGGAAGSVTLRGIGWVEINSVLLLDGGSTFAAGASTGGAAGVLSINENIGDSGPVRLFGESAVNGGAAVTGATGTDQQGGAGGAVIIGSSSASGTPGAPSSITIQGSILAPGGSGDGPSSSTVTGAVGGSITLKNDYPSPGNIVIRQLVTAQGGFGLDAGAKGGSVAISTNTGDVTIDSNLYAVGGYAGPGTCGDGGTATLSTVTGNIRVNASGSVSASGGVGGTGGKGGILSVSVGTPAVAASGNFTLAGTLTASGGIGSLGDGGDGGSVTVTVQDSAAGASTLAHAIFLSGSTASCTGAPGNPGRGGTGGAMSLTAQGNASLSGSIQVGGGTGTSGSGGSGGSISVISQGTATLSGAISAGGGNGASGSGGIGGTITTNVQGTTLLSGSISFSAGASGAAAAGGDGGTLTVLSVGQVTVSGSLTGSGGLSIGSNGGRGGLVDILTNPLGGGGADITIAAGGSIFVSGGTGFSGSNTGGSARNDGSPGVTDDPALVAVRLRSGTGIIRNLGIIVATGAANNGSGGDVLFDGWGAGGFPTPAPGTQSRFGSGSGSPGQFAGL